MWTCTESEASEAWVNKADNHSRDIDHLWWELQHSLSQLSLRKPASAEPASYHTPLQNISPEDRTLAWSWQSSGSGKCQPGGDLRNYLQLTLNAERTFLQWTFWIVSLTWRMRQVNIFEPGKLWLCFSWKKKKNVQTQQGVWRLQSFIWIKSQSLLGWKQRSEYEMLLVVFIKRSISSRWVDFSYTPLNRHLCC